MFESNRAGSRNSKRWMGVIAETKDKRKVYVIYYTYASSISELVSKSSALFRRFNQQLSSLLPHCISLFLGGFYRSHVVPRGSTLVVNSIAYNLPFFSFFASTSKMISRVFLRFYTRDRLKPP